MQKWFENRTGLHGVLFWVCLTALLLPLLATALYGSAFSLTIVTVAVLGSGLGFLVATEPSEMAVRRPKEITQLDLAGIRLALSASAYAAVRKDVTDVRGSSQASQVLSVMRALLRHQEEWVSTSLESTPRRDATQIVAAAKRLMEYAVRRFPGPQKRLFKT